jgi:hypothetical protein
MNRQEEEAIMVRVEELIDKKVAEALEKLKADIPKTPIEIKTPTLPAKKDTKK